MTSRFLATGMHSRSARFLVILFSLWMTGCSSDLQGQVQKGRYISESGEFSINFPYYNFGERAYRTMKGGDITIGNKEAVAFADHGNWYVGAGLYIAEWHRLDPGVDPTSYIANIERNFTAYTRDNYVSPDGKPVEFTIVVASNERLSDGLVFPQPGGNHNGGVASNERLSGRPASRWWIARGEFYGHRAVMATTAFNFGDRVGIVGLIYPANMWARYKEERWENPKEAIPWNFYLPFAESLRRLK